MPLKIQGGLARSKMSTKQLPLNANTQREKARQEVEMAVSEQQEVEA